MREINRHIVHCSASPENTTKDDIYKWHVTQNGWSDIGYHFIIHQDGTIEACRPVEKSGAHCKGYNADSIGTCLIGNEHFTVKQLSSLQHLHDLIKVMYGGSITIHGHREFTRLKTCPNFEVKQFIKE